MLPICYRVYEYSLDVIFPSQAILQQLLISKQKLNAGMTYYVTLTTLFFPHRPISQQ